VKNSARTVANCTSFFIREFLTKNNITVYCILASCYIRFTLNICSFVHQCNTFTFYFLLFVDMFRPHTAIFKCYNILSRSWCNKRTLTISTPSAEALGWQHHIGKNWHNRAPASGEYTITREDGHVRLKHVDE
jgi:hypothetical protein